MLSGSSRLGGLPAVSDASMKRRDSSPADEDIRPEYDFSALGRPVRGKYARRFAAGTNVVVLEPEVAKAFPDSAAVNDALRVVIRASRALKKPARRAAASSKGRPTSR